MPRLFQDELLSGYLTQFIFMDLIVRGISFKEFALIVPISANSFCKCVQMTTVWISSMLRHVRFRLVDFELVG